MLWESHTNKRNHPILALTHLAVQRDISFTPAAIFATMHLTATALLGFWLPATSSYACNHALRDTAWRRSRQLVNFGHPIVMAEEPTPAALSSYAEAETRGFELFQAGEHERAIRMFELAQTLPGEGVDLKRAKQGGMIGSATAPPNPREWVEDRFATAEQKLVAQYNIACCYAAMGDTPRCMELLMAYVAKVDEPLNQVNEMLVDDDLVSVRAELRTLRDELKTDKRPGLFGLPGLRNPLRDAAESIGVEWKD